MRTYPVYFNYAQNVTKLCNTFLSPHFYELVFLIRKGYLQNNHVKW